MFATKKKGHFHIALANTLLSNFTMTSLLSHPFIQALFFALIIPFCFSLTLIFLRKRSKISPPGPKKLPLIGNLHQLSDPPHRCFEKLAGEYGPIMLLQLGSVPTLVVSSADTAKEIFKAHDITFSGRPALYAAKRLSYGCKSVSFAPYGDHWREIRKVMILELLGPKRVQSFQAARGKEVGALLAEIAQASSSSSGSPVDLSELALSFANDVVCRVAFGKKYDASKRGRFREMLGETQSLLGGFCVADFFPWLGWINKMNGLDMRLEKCFGKLDKFYDEVIEEHLDPERPKAEHEDVVDVLLQLQKDSSQFVAVNNDQIKGVLTDIFIAGTDTTAATLIWIMAELIKNPSIMKKAQEEVREVAKGKGNKVLESDLPKLECLNMVIKEGFRLHLPVPLLVPRETLESCRIEGYEIPKKTRVFVNAKAIGRDPKNWADPNAFLPERFSGSSVDYRGQHFELLPFGAGRRGCPGTNFGALMIELALANLLCRFDWELPKGMGIEDLDMEEACGLTMHKKIPLCLVAKIVDIL